jgi:hypothetical protein
MSCDNETLLFLISLFIVVYLCVCLIRCVARSKLNDYAVSFESPVSTVVGSASNHNQSLLLATITVKIDIRRSKVDTLIWTEITEKPEPAKEKRQR